MIAFFYELLFVIPSALALLGIFASPAGFGEVTLLLLVLQLIPALLLIVYKNGGISGKIVTLGIASSVVILLIILSRYEFFLSRIVENKNYLFMLLFALAGFAAGELIAYIRGARIVVSVAALVFLVLSVFLKYGVDKIFVVSAFLIMLLTIALELQKSWKKEGNTDLKAHIVYISPFIVLIAAIVLIAPSSDKRYDWRGVKKAYSFVNNTVNDIRIMASIKKEKDYADSFMGFSEEGSALNGKVKENRDVALLILNIPPETSELKLAGKNFSDFTGREWVDNDTGTEPDSMLDTLGTIASLQEYTDEPEKYMMWNDLYVKYIRMNTSYIFSPAKTAVRRSHLPIENEEVIFEASDIMWPKKFSYKTEYSIAHLVMNTNSDEFEQFVKESKLPSKSAFNSARRKLVVSDNPAYSYEVFLANREKIYETYCKDVELSDETEALMNDLLKDCETDYDKLVRIQSLLKTFDYDTNPGEIPENIQSEKEFLDYFILKEQKGYCSFFATAFVLLARHEGIPARYVQGYNAKTSSKSSMYINSSMAHAWAEVYFDGAGWVVFDPTPGFGGGAYWNPSLTKTLPDLSKYQKEESQTNSFEKNIKTGTDEEKEAIDLKWYMFIIPPIFGIAIIMLIFAGFKTVSLYRFKKLDGDKRFVILCKQIFAILKILGHPINESETIAEYQLRLKKDYEADRLSFMNILEEYLYAECKDRGKIANACDAALLTRKIFLSELRKKKFLKYLIYHLKY